MTFNQTIVSGEARAVAAPQKEKLVNDAAAVAAPKEEKLVNEGAEVPVRTEKKKCRLRQTERERERNRQASIKEAGTAGMKKQGLLTTDDSCWTHTGNLLKQAGKQVIAFVKHTFETKASKATRSTECKSTRKRILKWRAQVPNSDHNIIVKRRAQLTNNAVPEGTILKWRAQVRNSDHNRIVKLRAQLANDAVPEGTTAVSFTPA